MSFFILGALLVLALLKAAVDSEESAGKWPRGVAGRCPGRKCAAQREFPTWDPVVRKVRRVLGRAHGTKLGVTGWG